MSTLHVVGLVYGGERTRERELGVRPNRNSKYGGVVKLQSVTDQRVDVSREPGTVKEGGRQTEEGQSEFGKLLERSRRAQFDVLCCTYIVIIIVRSMWLLACLGLTTTGHNR